MDKLVTLCWFSIAYPHHEGSGWQSSPHGAPELQHSRTLQEPSPVSKLKVHSLQPTWSTAGPCDRFSHATYWCLVYPLTVSYRKLYLAGVLTDSAQTLFWMDMSEKTQGWVQKTGAPSPDTLKGDYLLLLKALAMDEDHTEMVRSNCQGLRTGMLVQISLGRGNSPASSWGMAWKQPAPVDSNPTTHSHDCPQNYQQQEHFLSWALQKRSLGLSIYFFSCLPLFKSRAVKFWSKPH